MESNVFKDFIGSVFDLSFTEFVTTRLIKILFVLAIIGSGIETLVVLLGSLAGGVASGLLGLILSPFIFLILVVLSRVWLELVIVAFRIAENTGRMANACQCEAVQTPAPQPAPEPAAE